jgi:hypothetical protein
MHDHRHAYAPYEADTAVVDVEDWHPPLAEGEEVEMHISVDGLWHRDRVGAADRTACDKPYRFSIAQRRRPVLEGLLCPVCFTANEIADALEALAKEHREADRFIGINPRRRR